jgi:hypothetical protein
MGSGGLACDQAQEVASRAASAMTVQEKGTFRITFASGGMRRYNIYVPGTTKVSRQRLLFDKTISMQSFFPAFEAAFATATASSI